MKESQIDRKYKRKNVKHTGIILSDIHFPFLILDTVYLRIYWSKAYMEKEIDVT